MPAWPRNMVVLLCRFLPHLRFLKGPILILFLRKTKRNRVCLRIKQSQGRVKQRSAITGNHGSSSPYSIEFWRQINYLFSSIYFTTKFIINFWLLGEFLYQSEPVNEYSSKQLVTLTNRIYFVQIVGSSTFSAKFESACGVLRITTSCQCFEPGIEPGCGRGTRKTPINLIFKQQLLEMVILWPLIRN